ncbi:MAG: NADH-quinone oxidoreductase subunit M [Rhodomicrobium sp.]
MKDWPILSTIIFLPLLGALLLAILRGNDDAARKNARWIALWTTLITLGVSLVLAAQFDPANSGFQFIEHRPWLSNAITYYVGVDGLSLPFVILTTFLMPICILASWQAITVRVKEYMIAFLLLETLMIGVFCSLDLVLFYLFFEGGLIPMFLIIGVWGGPRRVYASFKFFLYTLLGSLLMLLAILAMYGQAGTTEIPALLKYHFPEGLQTWLWFAFLASFAVKLPMWPVHTWQPDAHVEAPTAGSVILAAILLKMGGYGFLRFLLPMFPAASVSYAPLMYVLGVTAIIYTSLVAFAQKDMKKLIAYSSVAHMGFVTIGVFSGTLPGAQGAVFQMISHGIVSGALFLSVGVVYDRMHTREIAAYGGLADRMPIYAFVFMVFTMANVGLPGTSGFIGEFLSLLGTFQANTVVAFFATFGIILSAVYALTLYRSIIFGKLERPSLASIRDMSPREIGIMAPLVILTLLLGFYPKPVLDTTSGAVTAMIAPYQQAVAARQAASEAPKLAQLQR